jgi:hypothetical protein
VSGPSRRRVGLVDRVAMELRQIEAEDVAAMSGNRYDRTAAETWARAAEVLRAGYRSDARRLLRVIRARMEDNL